MRLPWVAQRHFYVCDGRSTFKKEYKNLVRSQITFALTGRRQLVQLNQKGDDVPVQRGC
jgi:hypothetical protein